MISARRESSQAQQRRAGSVTPPRPARRCQRPMQRPGETSRTSVGTKKGTYRPPGFAWLAWLACRAAGQSGCWPVGLCAFRPVWLSRCRATANLCTKILDFRGFDSSRILILRGGILMSIGQFPESSSQTILAGIILVWRLGASGCPLSASPGG